MEPNLVVAVVGATGRQGGAVARHLLAGGWRVRALTRRPDSKRALELAQAGAEVVRADMAEVATLRAVFRDAYGVFSVQNPMTGGGVETEVRHGRNVADAAKAMGVQHLVYGSAGTGVPGTGVPEWESKLVVQAHMEALGLPATVLRPTAFMELMTDKAFFPPVSTWHLMPKLMGADRRVPWLSVDDLGAIAARAFGDPDRFVGNELRLAGDLLSIDECRAIWAEVKGRPPRPFPMPVWLFERFVGTDLTTMWRWLRSGTVHADPSETRKILPTVSTVRDWLTKRQAAHA
jgi:uncharacterized protein YbjT (DUF2867 family)